MPIKYIVGIAVVTAVLTTVVLVPKLVNGSEVPPVEVTQKAELSVPQIIWLARLMQCESGIRSNAVNPKDLDNLPSFGILQFKPGTYASAAKKYGLASTTDYMNPEGQVTIVEQWILTGVNLTNQFPGCIKKLGYPPSKGT